MITTPRGLLLAFPRQFPAGRPPLVARGWFRVVADLCARVDEVVDEVFGPQPNAFRWVRFDEKHGALQARWEADDLVPAAGERIEALVRRAVEASAGTCVECGQPGQLRASMDYLLPLCAEHTRERDAGRWLRIHWLAADEEGCQ